MNGEESADEKLRVETGLRRKIHAIKCPEGVRNTKPEKSISEVPSEVSGDNGQDISGEKRQMARGRAVAGSKDEAGHVNTVSGNLGLVLTVPGQQRPWPQRHKEKIRVMPSDDDKKDPKVGREENVKLGRRNISLLFIKGKWMLQHWGRRAENAKSFSIPKGKTRPNATIHL